MKAIVTDGPTKRNLRVVCGALRHYEQCGKPLAEAVFLDGRWHLLGRLNRYNINGPLTLAERAGWTPHMGGQGLPLIDADGIKGLRVMDRPKMQPTKGAYSLQCGCGATPRLSLERLTTMAWKARNAGAPSIVVS